MIAPLLRWKLGARFLANEAPEGAGLAFELAIFRVREIGDFAHSDCDRRQEASSRRRYDVSAGIMLLKLCGELTKTEDGRSQHEDIKGLEGSGNVFT